LLSYEGRQATISANFKEAKIKWRRSEAKRKLYLLILDGEIADTDSEDLSKIYLMDEELSTTLVCSSKDFRHYDMS
jgi:hypothetical protein